MNFISNKSKIILWVTIAVLTIFVIALWKQNNSLKKQIIKEDIRGEALKLTPKEKKQELEMLQDQLKQLLELQKQLE